MIYSIHHTHKNGVTITVLHKALSNASIWFAKDGHEECKDIAAHHKGKVVHYFTEASRELVYIKENINAN